MIHQLKTWPAPFRAVVEKRKTHEIRRADRPYAVGDKLLLREWQPDPDREGCACEGYTGRWVIVLVTHLTIGGAWDIPIGLVVMSVRLCEKVEGGELLAKAIKQAANRCNN